MFTALNSKPLNKTLPALWLFAILNVLFKDLHEMAKASTLEDILAGQFNGNPVTEIILLAGGIAVEILLLVWLLSILLPDRFVRPINLVAAPLATIASTAVPPTDMDDVFFMGVGFLTFATIFVLAWTAKPATQLAHRSVHPSNG